MIDKYFIHKKTGQIFTERELAKYPAKVELEPYNPPKYLKHKVNGRIQLWTPLLAKSKNYTVYHGEPEKKTAPVPKQPASKSTTNSAGDSHLSLSME